jgi:hypothetical protein
VSYTYHKPLIADSAERWRAYVETLVWQPGQLDDASYHAFLRAGSLGIDRQTALSVVAEKIQSTEARLRSCKVESQLERAYRHVSASTTGAIAPFNIESRPRRLWPARDLETVERVTAGGPDLYELWESSPVRFDDADAHTEAIVDALFPGNPLLCVGLTDYKFWTQDRESFRGRLPDLQFIVSNPMTALLGHRIEDGQLSAHTLENTGPRRFLVIEFDQGSADEQAALLDYLSRRGPLVLVVHSGGKSLHGWFYCVDSPDETLRRFMVLARRLGADLATWRNRSQFVRMPDGRRAPSGNRQTVFYFNPESLYASHE